jgi:gliding motility-associated-like protein
MRYLANLIIAFALFQTANAQYTVNGDATQDNCRCYTLTQNAMTESGSVWNNNRINLNQSFSFTFDVFLGCSDGGADGIAFVMQPISTSVGGDGSGMGFGNINPSVGVTLDTYQNTMPDNDPLYDHIAIQINGDVNHSSANTLTPLTPVSATSNNVEDCIFHKLNITWNAVTKNLAVSFDNQPRINVTRDFVNTIFGGNGSVFWGFTGATGALTNLQRFCTILSPGMKSLAGQKRCVGEPIQFTDSTTTFGGIIKQYWNFGDGSPLDSVNLNPIHTYTTPGDYTVSIRVIALDSCEETRSFPISVGSKPVPGFTTSDSCVSNNIVFTDTSTNVYGTLTNWYWNLDNGGPGVITQNTSYTYTTPGPKIIKFIVKSQFGCESDTLVKTVRVRARPSVDFNFTDSVCFGTPTSFFENCSLSDGPVNYWSWTYSDSAFATTVENPTHVFTSPGAHTVTLTASGTGSNACLGSTVTKPVFVVDKPRARMRQIIICEQQPAQLFDSSFTPDGTAITNWWWDLGNGQFSTQQNPTVIYTGSGPRVIRHVVRNARGCLSDTTDINLNIADKPVPGFLMTAPLCDNDRITFTDTSTVVNGTVSQWQWSYAGITFANTQQASNSFGPGNQTVQLTVTSSLGCVSAVSVQSFFMKTKPRAAINFGDTCKFAPVIFTANENPTNIGITQWNWSFGDGQSGQGSPVSHTYLANGAYNISLFGISTEGCPTDTIPGTVNVYGTDAFAGNDTIAAANQPIRLNASGGVSYEWTPSEGLSATNIPNPIATVESDKTYYLRAYTPEGCESFDTINIKIYKGPEIYVPTAFTPNNDGLNDVIKPICIGLRTFISFTVFNRYGERVFITSAEFDGWDGMYKGARQPSGTYVWIASGIDFRGNPLTRKGSFMILR